MTGSSNTFYEYRPIDLDTDAIRVLRLHRGFSTDPISCELVEIFLCDDGVPYEALSYTWGDSSVNVEITLCGCLKLVRDNLYTTLYCLRKVNEDRFLWIDALCIDQENLKEKTHQVGRMRRIYEKAERVIIWLGKTSEDIDLLMDMGMRLAKRVRRRKGYRRDEEGAWMEEWPGFVRELGGMETDFNRRRREALGQMLGMRWFQRVWVFQEVFSAKRATIQCGWNELPTEAFVIMPRLMGLKVESHIHSVLDIMPGYLRKTSWRNERPELRTLLRKFHESEATDERDKIYALLGIASDADINSKLLPDYNESPGDVIKNAVSYLLFDDGTKRICPLPDWNFKILVQYLDELSLRVLEWGFLNGVEATIREVLARTDVNINLTPQGGQLDPPLIRFVRYANRWNFATSRNIIRMLLTQQSINVNIEDESGSTPLHIAVSLGNSIMVEELLIHQDIDPNKPNIQLKTPLGIAAEKGHNAMLSSLLQHSSVEIEYPNGISGFSREATPLWLAASRGYQSTVELLLQHGANIDAQDTLTGETPLFAACKRGDIFMAEFLVSRGANISARDTFNNATPIWAAASEGHLPVLTLLLSRGATLDDGRQVRNRQTALLAASGAGHFEVVLAILKYLRAAPQPSPRINSVNEYCDIKDIHYHASALWVAAHCGQTKIVEMLLDAGADINSKDNLNHNVLWTAIFNNHDEVVRVLLDRGARLEPGDAVLDYSEHGIFAGFLSRAKVVRHFLAAGWRIKDIEKEIKRVNGNG